MEPTRVLIADDEETVLDVLKAIMASESDLELVGAATDAETAIELAARERPDVAVLDVRMPGGGGTRATREILRRSPPTRVIAVSAHEDVGSVLEMLRAGALGYVVKSESTEEILRAIRRSIDERPTLPARVTPDMVHALAEQMHRVSQGSERRREQEERIRRVLDHDVLAILFQPIVDLQDGEVVGMEALPRFNTLPRRSPDAWFAEAEAAGLLLDLEVAMVRAALAHLEGLPRAAYLSVNLSPRTAASPEFREALGGVPLERLVVEVTEHARVDDYVDLNEALCSLRSEGLRLAIDDAGAGFASLRHIVSLGPDLIKLDTTLTHGIEGDETRRALVAALVAFGSQIEADVVAEDVGTAEQLEALRRVGVRFAQGLYLGPPHPISHDGTASGRPLSLADTGGERLTDPGAP